MNSVLFPASQYWWFYLLFSAFVTVLLSLDLMLHRDRQTGLRAAAAWTAVWVALALAFGAGLYWFARAQCGPAAGRQVTLEYLAGYLMEESLSVDNMFVFALIFRYFAIPGRYQHRVLFYGVLGAMVFRGVFIAAGAALVHFHWVVAGFGLFLVASGAKLAFAEEKRVDPGANPAIRLARRLLPVTGELRGHRFLARVDRRWHMTPLLVVLLALETTDILFAVDSVPAVFGVTREPLIVYTSNIFAILGLRSLYFLLAGALDRFRNLKYGLALVLVFVGLKMSLLDAFGLARIPVGWSLAVIAGCIGGSVALPAIREKLRRGRIGARHALGALCAGLGCLCFAAAAGPAERFLDAGFAGVIEDEWLWVSGACYEICGWIFLRGRRDAGKPAR